MVSPIFLPVLISGSLVVAFAFERVPVVELLRVVLLVVFDFVVFLVG